MSVETSERIIKSIFPEFDAAMFIADGKTYRSAEFVKVPLSRFNVENKKKFNVSDCFVWVPKHSLGNIKARTKFVIESPISDALFAILRTPSAGLQTFVLKGDGIRVLSLSQSSMSYVARLMRSSRMIIGENTFIGSARFALVDTDLTIGAGGLWSDDIIVQGADQHGVLDLSSKKVTNAGRTFVAFERHVWVGRRAIISKNVKIGAGSIVATGSIVTKNVPPAAVVAGNPAKIVKHGTTWTNSPEGPVARELNDIESLSAYAAVVAPVLPRPARSASSRVADWLSSVWVKAVAAGITGAAVFEVFTEILPGL